MTNKWYCTCLEWSNVGKSKAQRHKKLHLTTANEKGICDNCGYYSVAISDYELYPRGFTIDGYRPAAAAVKEWQKKGLSATLKKLYFNPGLDIEPHKLFKKSSKYIFDSIGKFRPVLRIKIKQEEEEN